MRQLDRTSVDEPNCLANYQAGTHNWGDVTWVHKQEIRDGLEQLQGRRCAYCEGSLDSLGNHIEHFRRKGDSRFQHLTFSWENLYWSCDKNDSCGKYKDQRAGDFDLSFLFRGTQSPEPIARLAVAGSGIVRYALSDLL